MNQARLTALVCLALFLSACPSMPGSPDRPVPQVTDRAESFPPAAPKPVEVDYGKLEVVRHNPSADKDVVQSVSVTFNQPIVPLTSLDALDAITPPLELSPKVPGKYRWLGTKTVSFVPDEPLPAATQFSARVPGTAKGMSGEPLGADFTWTFKTRLPRVLNVSPSNYERWAGRDTTIVLQYNQPVDAESVAKHLTITAGKKKVGFKIKAAKDGVTGRPVVDDKKLANRRVEIVPRNLPLNASIKIKVAPGVVGTQGPLASTENWHGSFRTYGPLAFEDLRCWSTPCQVTGAVYLRFSNPLAQGALDHVTFNPPLTHMDRVEVGSNYINLYQTFEPNTTYTVTFKKTLKDRFGQRLGKTVKRSFQVGDYAPAMALESRNAVVEASGPGRIAAQFINVPASELTVTRVSEENLAQAWNWVHRTAGQRRWDRNFIPKPAALKGATGTRSKLKTGGKLNEKIDREISLGKDAAAGIHLVEVRATVKNDRWVSYAPHDEGLVQYTELGLNVWYDYDQMLVWLTRLGDTETVGGARVAIRGEDGQLLWEGKTAADGTAILPAATAIKADPPYFVVASQGKDAAFVRIDGSTIGGGQWLHAYQSPDYIPTPKRLVGHIHSERGIYRPGEKAHIKGTLRLMDRHGLETLPKSVKHVRVKVDDARGQTLLEKEVELRPNGAFSLTVQTEAKGALGNYSVYATPLGLDNVKPEQTRGSFAVEAYRAPEFAVTAEIDKQHYIAGEELEAKVTGRYLFGAPMRGANANWYLRATPSYFRPKGWSGYAFGGSTEEFSWSTENLASGSAPLSADGELAIKSKLAKRARVPYSVQLAAEVIDANRQSVAGRASTLMHPASAYFGIGLDSWVFKKGEKIPTKLVAVDFDGKNVNGLDGSLKLQRSEWKLVFSKDRTRDTSRWENLWPEVATCKFTTGKDPASCSVTPDKGGYYRLVARGKDAAGREMESVRYVWVAGPDFKKRDDDLKVDIVFDKEKYEVGDTARILVTSPFPKARALLTWSRLGLVEHQDLGEIGATKLLEIPITEKSIPGLQLGVVLVRGRDGAVPKTAKGDKKRPLIVSGSGSMQVSTDRKTLQVTVTPDKQEIRPGQKTNLTVTTKNPDGKGTQSELMVAIVDEGVLSLIAFGTPNPLQVFWALRQAELAGADVRPALVKGVATVPLRSAEHVYRDGKDRRQKDEAKKPSPKKARVTVSADAPAAAEAPEPEALEEEKEGEESPADEDQNAASGEDDGDGPRLRTRFETTAYWMAHMETGKDGVATFSVEMPDNLTTFRVMAVAQDGRDHFGSGEGSITINQPLLLRAALPRFSLPGDEFSAGVVVNNETGEAGKVTVKVTARGAEIGDSTSKTMEIAKGGAAEVAFLVRTPTPGTAVFTYEARFVGAGGAKASDAVEARMPVQIPITTESVATYGTTESAVAVGLAPPDDVYEDVGGLEVTLSSTILTNLHDAIEYLVEYPYGCLEQTASRVLPLIVLRELVVRYGISGLDGKEIDAMVATGIEKMVSLQRWSGGFAYWPSSSTAYPYASIYAMFVLNEAKKRDYNVSDDVMSRGADYVMEVLRTGRNPDTGYPVGNVTLAFAAAVLGEIDPKRIDEKRLDAVLAEREKLPLFARAFLAIGYSAKVGNDDKRTQQLMQDLSNNAVEEASDAHFAEPKADSYVEFFSSNSRTDAIALLAYMRIAPDDVLVPKVARGLMEARVRGRWANTQENAYALLSLDRYAQHYEKDTPDFIARLWRGDTFLVEEEFRGRDTKAARSDIAMRELRKSSGDLVLAKEGPGRLYYRLGMTYAPTSQVLPARENGFSIERRYFVDGKPVGETEVEVAAGSYVKVHLTVVVPVEHHWVVVDDPLPAGVEPVNLKFATSLATLDTQTGTKNQSYWGWWWPVSWDHTEQRDDRVLLFADRLSPGVYEHSYVVRATTPGTFYLPPSKISEMYQPEVMGRTASGRFVVQK